LPNDWPPSSTSLSACSSEQQPPGVSADDPCAEAVLPFLDYSQMIKELRPSPRLT
jgi:hypothetical protein